MNAIKMYIKQWIQQLEEKSNYFVENFQNLCQTSNANFLDDLPNTINLSISNKENLRLIKIENIIREMDPLRALDPDVNLFYKNTGHIIKEDFVNFINNFFKSWH